MHCKPLWIKASAKCINVNVKKGMKYFVENFSFSPSGTSVSIQPDYAEEFNHEQLYFSQEICRRLPKLPL